MLHAYYLNDKDEIKVNYFWPINLIYESPTVSYLIITTREIDILITNTEGCSSGFWKGGEIEQSLSNPDRNKELFKSL